MSDTDKQAILKRASEFGINTNDWSQDKKDKFCATIIHTSCATQVPLWKVIDTIAFLLLNPFNGVSNE